MIFELFEQKWQRFGRRFFWCCRSVELVFIVLLLYTAISLKIYPATCDRVVVPVRVGVGVGVGVGAVFPVACTL